MKTQITGLGKASPRTFQWLEGEKISKEKIRDLENKPKHLILYYSSRKRGNTLKNNKRKFR